MFDEVVTKALLFIGATATTSSTIAAFFVGYDLAGRSLGRIDQF
ncbi:MAG: hypothetical protein QX197_10045 [Methylococcaceae bacterium]